MVLIRTKVGRVKVQGVTNDCGVKYNIVKKILKIIVALGKRCQRRGLFVQPEE